jgi:hypothetical protein
MRSLNPRPKFWMNLKHKLEEKFRRRASTWLSDYPNLLHIDKAMNETRLQMI